MIISPITNWRYDLRRINIPMGVSTYKKAKELLDEYRIAIGQLKELL